MASPPKKLRAADTRSIAMLESLAKKTAQARNRVDPDGLCSERIRDALEECEAIMKDAARNCRMQPFIPPTREQ